MEKKIANDRQQASNRARWRRDLSRPEREQTRCEADRIRIRYVEGDLPPELQWCAGGRAVQLLIENPGMIDQEHYTLAGRPPVAGWEFRLYEPEEPPPPVWTPGVADINRSTFHNFYDLMQQVYGVDERTMSEIETANDERVPMQEIAKMIPTAE